MDSRIAPKVAVSNNPSLFVLQVKTNKSQQLFHRLRNNSRRKDDQEARREGEEKENSRSKVPLLIW